MLKAKKLPAPHTRDARSTRYHPSWPNSYTSRPTQIL